MFSNENVNINFERYDFFKSSEVYLFFLNYKIHYIGSNYSLVSSKKKPWNLPLKMTL